MPITDRIVQLQASIDSLQAEISSLSESKRMLESTDTLSEIKNKLADLETATIAFEGATSADTQRKIKVLNLGSTVEISLQLLSQAQSELLHLKFIEDKAKKIG